MASASLRSFLASPALPKGLHELRGHDAWPQAHCRAVLPGSRNILVSAPRGAAQAIGLPREELASRLNGRFDYIHVFATQAAKLSERLPTLKRHLKSDGKLWVSWPKMGKQSTDLNLREVIRLAYDIGLVESKTISFDEVWSAIKLTHPKPGKVYRNSYGRLPGGAA